MNNFHMHANFFMGGDLYSKSSVLAINLRWVVPDFFSC